MSTASAPVEQDREVDASGRLDNDRRRYLAGLGVPALGLTFAVTVVSTYAPVLLGGKTNPVVVGCVVGGEGLFALLLPLLVGNLSDRTSSSARDRSRAMLFTAPFAVAGLAVLAVPGGLPAVVAGAGLYFAAHFSYLTPFQALYADVVDDEESGRSRSFESIWRLAGAGLALIGGGFLIEAWSPLPFLVGAALVAATTLVFWRFLRQHDDVEVTKSHDDLRQLLGTVRQLLDDREIRLLVIANTLWNLTLSALRAFVVLFFTVGLGRSPSFVSGIIFPLVALGLAVAAPLAGKLADRVGHVRVLQVAVPVYGLGLLLPAFWQRPWVGALVPIVAGAAATVMTIPFAALMERMPDGDHGAASGLFTLSRGLGGVLGPLLAGAAILLMKGVFASTHGFAAMWLVIGPSTLLTIPLLQRMSNDAGPAQRS